MTTTDEARQCGAANFRCASCESATAAPLDQCPKCRSNDIVPSTCRRLVRDSATRCHQHGGRAAQVVAASTTRAVETKLYALLEQYGVGPCTDPLQALVDLAGETVAFKSLAGDRLASIRAEDWRWEGRTGEQTRAEVLIYEKAMERAAKILADIARLNLDDRLLAFHAQVEQQKADRWGDILEATLADVLPDALARAVGRRFAQRLRASHGADLPALGEVPDYVRADSIEAQVRQGVSSEIDAPGIDLMPTDDARIVPVDQSDSPQEPPESVETPVTAPKRQAGDKGVVIYPEDEVRKAEKPARRGPDGRPVDGPTSTIGKPATAETLDQLFGTRRGR